MAPMKHWGPFALIATLMIAGCNSGKKNIIDEAPHASASAVSSAPPLPPPVPAETEEQKLTREIREKLEKVEVITDAIGALKPMMRDTNNAKDPGARMLTEWAVGRGGMPWAELMAIPETSLAKVKKDSDAERGNRICGAGRIIEIHTEKTPRGNFYYGTMIIGAMDVVSFVAVGSSGDIVEKSTARFCGIVTGTNSYANSGGGTSHAVRVVGVFDLPENKKPVAKK